jgi:hypothetical protein
LLIALAPPAHADENSEQAAADLLHRRLQNEAPEDVQLLQLVHGKDVVVVAGGMDHIESVLNATRIQHTLIQPAQVAGWPLKSSMIVMIDCPGMIPDEGLKRIEHFVRAGGLLYTTDWALKNVIEKAFPNTIASTNGVTESEVVPVKVDKESANLMSRMLLRKGSQPQWWLEGGSFPIRVLDKQRVEVLAHSDAMQTRYGASPVVVRFPWEDGEVIHVVSHFYRQMATEGPKVASANSVDSFDGLSAKDKAEFRSSGVAASAPVGDVESSYAFQRMTSNLVTGKQRRNVQLDQLYNRKVKAPIALRAEEKPTAPTVVQAAPADKLRVLEKKGKTVRVRDDRGNEGWVDESQLQ